eukprot:COSAG02_NODE_2331_length_9118_cov_10.642976_1_plen_307_part_10
MRCQLVRPCTKYRSEIVVRHCSKYRTEVACDLHVGAAAFDRAESKFEVATSAVEGNCTGGWQMGPPSNKTLEPCVCDPKSFGCPTVDPAFNLSHVQFAGSFLSGMVLQRGPGQSALFGTAPPGSTVTVRATGPNDWSFSGHGTASTLVDAELHGSWKILLPARPAGSGYSITATCSDGSEQTLVNVSFGDIWFCTGQVRKSCQPSTCHHECSFASAGGTQWIHTSLTCRRTCHVLYRAIWRIPCPRPSRAITRILPQTLESSITSSCSRLGGAHERTRRGSSRLMAAPPQSHGRLCVRLSLHHHPEI